MVAKRKSFSRGLFSRFINRDDGSSAMEYAIMLGLIGMTLLPMVQAVGQKISGVARSVTDGLSSATEPAPLPNPGFFNPAPEDTSTQ
jgi:Flp pilus assembly pilin Flp